MNAPLSNDQQCMSDEHQQLARFYDVGTLTALVDAQAKHIERLQQLVRQLPGPGYYVDYQRSPREG